MIILTPEEQILADKMMDAGPTKEEVEIWIEDAIRSRLDAALAYLWIEASGQAHTINPREIVVIYPNTGISDELLQARLARGLSENEQPALED